MKRKIGYKLGYQIQINNGFYEVSAGRKVYYYGNCRRNSTIQEIVNKTIMSDDDSVNARRKAELAAVVGL